MMWLMVRDILRLRNGPLEKSWGEGEGGTLSLDDNFLCHLFMQDFFGSRQLLHFPSFFVAQFLFFSFFLA